MTNLEPNEPKKAKPFITKEGFFELVKHHKWDSLAYLLIFTGLIISIFNQIVGGLIVGVILGLYYSDQVKVRFDMFKEFLDENGIFRCFIVIAAIVALLITTFGLCVGTLIGVYLRPIFGGLIQPPFKDEKQEQAQAQGQKQEQEQEQEQE